ncbi:MAG: vitamin B12 dependent methionine synthase [Raoultibacter sp.]
MKYSVDRQEALRYLGYSGQRVEGDFRKRFDAIVAACERGLHPTFATQVFDADDAQKDAEGKPCITLLGTTLVFSGEDIYAHLQGAHRVALMACTLGMQSERELRRYNARSPLDALIYGAAASSLVEQVADAAEAKVVAQATQAGLFTGSRYSPGYGDFSLDIQSQFLECLGAPRRMGLSATASNFLIPTKSITAVIGLFDQPPAAVPSTCDTCTMKQFCSIKASGETCYE